MGIFEFIIFLECPKFPTQLQFYDQGSLVGSIFNMKVNDVAKKAATAAIGFMGNRIVARNKQIAHAEECHRFAVL